MFYACIALMLILIIPTHTYSQENINTVSFEQSKEKHRNIILKITQDNDTLATECQQLLDAIGQEIEQANQLNAHLLLMNECCLALEQFLEQATSFLKNLQEYKRTEKFDAEKNKSFQQKYECIIHRYETLQTTLPSLESFIQNDMKTYKQLLISIRANVQKLEENTPLKKSKYLQFFNSTKQLESAREQYQKTISDADTDWLPLHTKSIMEKNKEVKSKYTHFADHIKNNLEILESSTTPDDSCSANIDLFQKLYQDIQQEIDFIFELSQNNSLQSSKIEDNLENRIANNMQNIKKKHIIHDSILKEHQAPMLKRKNNNSTEKKEYARLKAAQKKEDRIKKQEEKKRKKEELAVLKKEKQQNRKKQLHSSPIAAPQDTKARPVINATITKKDIPTKASEITFAKITEEYNSTTKELQLLQQSEEQENLLMISHNEQHIALEKDIEDLEKQTDLFIALTAHLKINDSLPIIMQNLEQESELINTLKHLYDEQHNILLKQQFIKEQNSIKLEQLLQQSLKLYETELQELQSQSKTLEQEKIAHAYEKLHTLDHEKIRETKEQNFIKAEKILHIQKIIQKKIQEFTQCQKAQTDLLKSTLLSQKQIDTLMPISKQQNQTYHKFMTSQKTLAKTNAHLLRIKNNSQEKTTHETIHKSTVKEVIMEKDKHKQISSIPEKTEIESIQDIEKKRNAVVYQLQELQYHEEKDNLLKATIQEQEAYVQEQIDDLKKEIDQSKEMLQEMALDQELKDPLANLYNTQKKHLHDIEALNEEMEQYFFAQQNLKEQHLLVQEEFLKRIYLAYHAVLEKTKASEQESDSDQKQENFETLIINLEQEYQQKTILYKKDFVSGKNKLLEKQKLLQKELQFLKNIEAPIEKIIYPLEFSPQLNQLQSLHKKQIESLDQCTRAQLDIEKKIDLFLSVE